MSKLYPSLAIIAIAISAFIQTGFGQQTNIYPLTGSVGIGTTTPDSSSLLEIKSTRKGFLMPRMTLSQRNHIVNPATGLIIYQTNSTPGFYYFTGAAWTPVLLGSNSWQITGNAGITNASFLGTTDNHALRFKVKNIYAGMIDPAGNVSFGLRSLFSNTTANSNIAIGTGALFANTNVSNLVAVGDSALYNNGKGGSAFFAGNANTAIGSKALFSNTTGYYNTASGSKALFSNTYGTQNLADGVQALYSNVGGAGNTASGFFALYSNVNGSSNTATGADALYANLADNNTADGSSALTQNTTGDLNTAVGSYALATNLDGYRNTGIGANALQQNTTGIFNTAVGYGASATANLGNYNTAVGAYALENNVSGAGNTAIGYYADVSAPELVFAMALGYGAISNATGKVVVGDDNVTVIGGQVGWSTLSDARFKSNVKENVPGLTFINRLKPVTYNLQLEKFDRFLGKKDSLIQSGRANYSTAERKMHTGFIAQDVEVAAQQIQYDFDGVNHPKSDKDNYSLVYADFVPSLVKAVQELSKANDSKDSVIQALESRLSKLEAMMNAQNTGRNQQMSSLTSAALAQNVPNPFNHSTTINYTLPGQYTSAKIVVSGKSGTALKEITVSGSGKGSVKVDASILAAGAYTYSLFVDGRLIGSKQMVLAK